VTANNLSTAAAGSFFVPLGGSLPLGNNFTLNGTAIQHTNGSTDITLNPNQTYQASYSTQASVGANGSVQVGFVLNGVGIPGSGTVGMYPPGSMATLSNTIIFNAPSGGTLNLANFNPGTTFTNTQVSVVKLA
jgi:hypothetical protein